jgi:hypothetical protein
MDTESGAVGILLDNPKFIDIIQKAAEVEENGSGPPWRSGWDYSDVEAQPATLSQMAQHGMLDIVQRPSGDANRYELIESEQLLESTKLITDGPEKEQEPDSTTREDSVEQPDDLFDNIIGHEPVKDLLSRGMSTDNQTHFRLQGESSTAKSLFLTEIERLPNSKYRSASGMTEAGLLDILMEQQPKYLLFDEIDKADNDCYTPLYELTEHGRVQKTISGQDVNIQLDCNLIVTLNHPDRLPQELKNRMVRLDFEEYDDDQYVEVVTGVLQDKFDLDEEVAAFIAEYQLEELGVKNVREPEQIAKLADNDLDDVKSVIENIQQYRV